MFESSNSFITSGLNSLAAKFHRVDINRDHVLKLTKRYTSMHILIRLKIVSFSQCFRDMHPYQNS